MNIYGMKVGESGTIKEVLGDPKLAKRLKALGCVRGTQVKVKLVAPLGDPILITFRGFDLAIRKNDAKNIYLNV
ncbi:ferrous iron transport protein A [Clostridium sp. Sa3CUN1]|uniref:Ferrous iron transport protein A n=1 Tax=Clostridium gallinarum TaxID=2762246 RepID=A0ABR8Q815_9CLOT|nr:ferrous iron transport protein A [Clostridium gallinarum]MBD7916579.1 ferrous iron transport protein A [Clostridium gallinarum]